MKRTFGVMALGLALAAGGVRLAAAAEGPRGSGEDARRAHWLAEELGLTEEQRASWRAMRQQHQTEMQPLMEQGRALHEKLREALKAENPDPQVVGEATLALEQHRKTMEAAQQAYHEKLATQLTPEQKAKFDEIAQRHRMRSHGPEGHRPESRRSAPEPEAPPSAKS